MQLTMDRLGFDNSYARLPDRFYARLAPTPVREPRLVRLNGSLAKELGLDPERLAGPEGAEIFGGNRLPEDAEPIALAYAGHQFGNFVPQLGDGRAILLGEVVGRDGKRRDVQLKGSGPTPFSRRGDGRAAIGPVLREYIVSEAMAAFGIPTTRSLAAVTTGERVLREEPLPGAVLTRVAASHVRVGTFQYFAARQDFEAVRMLADHVIERHYPELSKATHPYRALLEAVSERQGRLVAQWLLVGFIHGVMNTDNTSIAGETIDYGPCAFLDEYDPRAVFSSIDQMGRYAYANQPAIAQWNLTRLAECLLPLIDEDEEKAVEQATEALDVFGKSFNEAYLAGLRRKLGLAAEREGDLELAQDLLGRMAAGKADFTLTFRRLCDAAEDPGKDETVRALFAEPLAFDEWVEGWRTRREEEPGTGEDHARAMRTANPAFIPRNHLIEAAIVAAAERNDFGPFEELVTVLSRPYDDQPEFARYAEPPRPEERVLETFCGT